LRDLYPLVPLLHILLAIGIIGYDLQVASQNLKKFSNNRVKNIGTNIFNSLVKTNSKENFEKEIMKTATKGTILARMHL